MEKEYRFMGLLTIDREKCKRDRICVTECPLGILAFDEEGQTPKPTADAGDLCIECGHCVAVCPHGALSHRSMGPDECPPVRRELQPGPEAAEHFLRARRSIRIYRKKPVERSLIEKLIDIARYAPSGHNRQPVRWLVIYDSEEVQRLAGMVVDWMRYMLKEHREIAAPMHMDRVVAAWENGDDRVCRNAPHVIVAHAPKEDRSATAACTIALAYLELAAQPLGLGACWAGYFNAAATLWPPMQEALALPAEHISYGAMMIGHPKLDYHRLPLRKVPEITWR